MYLITVYKQTYAVGLHKSYEQWQDMFIYKAPFTHMAI